MGALNLPSAGDLERLTRRLRSVSQRLEAIEDNLDRLIQHIGVDHVLFGSDYPHPEGLAEPCSYVDHLPPGLSDAEIAAIMGGNLASIMKVPVKV